MALQTELSTQPSNSPVMASSPFSSPLRASLTRDTSAGSASFAACTMRHSPHRARMEEWHGKLDEVFG